MQKKKYSIFFLFFNRSSIFFHGFRNIPDDPFQGNFRLPSGQSTDRRAVRRTVQHVFKPAFIRLVIRNIFQYGRGPELRNHQFCKRFDRNAPRGTDVVNVAVRLLAADQSPKRTDRVKYMTETARLFSGAENPDRFIPQGGSYKARQNCPVWRGPTVLKNRTTVPRSCLLRRYAISRNSSSSLLHA